MILAVDLGGTNVRLGLVDERDDSFQLSGVRSLKSRDFNHLSDVFRAYLKDNPAKISAVAIGVPGPVTGSTAQVTNLPWHLDSNDLARDLGIEHVFLLNDLESHGYGIPLLKGPQVHCLRKGVEKIGNRALIAAGTGLGEGILFWDGKFHVPSPSEGGHSNFGPTNAEELELLRYVWAQGHHHVSWERIVSGSMGFANIFGYLRSTGCYQVTADLDEAIHAQDDIGAVIGAAAESGVEIARRTLEMFLHLYASEAGNLALKSFAVGGVYFGGGIAPRVLSWMSKPEFFDSFSNKGRFRNLLDDIPLYVILEPENALLGAANYARRRLTAGE